MKRITLAGALGCLAGIVLACGGGGGRDGAKKSPQPAELTYPTAFSATDPPTALHFLIHAYQPVLSASATKPEEHQRAGQEWKKKMETLRGTEVAWPMDVARTIEGKASLVRVAHPYSEADLRDDPSLPGPVYVLDPTPATKSPTAFFPVTGLPEWLLQVQPGAPVLLSGTIRGVEVDIPSELSKKLLRFRVLLDDAVIKQR